MLRLHYFPTPPLHHEVVFHLPSGGASDSVWDSGPGSGGWKLFGGTKLPYDFFGRWVIGNVGMPLSTVSSVDQVNLDLVGSMPDNSNSPQLRRILNVSDFFGYFRNIRDGLVFSQADSITDKPVRHLNISGELNVSPGSPYIPIRGVSDPQSRDWYGSVSVDNMGGYTPVLTSTSGPAWESLVHLMDRVDLSQYDSEPWVHVFSGETSGYCRSTKNIRVVPTGSVVVIEYDALGQINHHAPANVIRWCYHIRHVLSSSGIFPVEDCALTEISSCRILTTGVLSHYSEHETIPESSGWSQWQLGQFTDNHDLVVFDLEYPDSWVGVYSLPSWGESPLTTIGYDPQVGFLNTGSKSFYAFHATSLNHIGDMAALCSNSSWTAIDNYYSGLSQNNIESLLELGDLGGLVSLNKLLGASKALFSERPGRGLSTKSWLIRVLDVLSSGKLIYSFALSPTAALAEEAAEKARRIRSILIDLTRWGRMDSLVEFPLSDFLGEDFDPSVVRARSKLYGRISPDSFLTWFLPLRMLGLAPTLSGLWDLLPSSWLFDWFFQIGRRLDVVDNSVLALSLELRYGVHSISIEHEISELGDARYKYYERFVNNGSVNFVPTRLPLFSAYVPDWGTAGSYVYKLIRR